MLFFHCFLALGLTVSIFADEGMWVPLLLEKTCYQEMKERGCMLSPEEIYSINHASLKDAVTLFAKGCTGVMVSDSGLLLTNYHCGYSTVQSFSSREHDYLNNGFWAMKRSEELSCPSLTVSFLKKMEDVTATVLKGVSADMNEEDRNDRIGKNIDSLSDAQSKASGYQVQIKPLYNENQYFLYAYEVFRDVRLVGAPPSGIGKFGGDTDNWIWPRHTGDFSVFRIYADNNNRPASYAPENIPYKPGKYLPISIKGVAENDFTMVYGFPGSTSECMTATELEFLQKVDLPHKINIRALRLDIMDEAMKRDRITQIQYAAKYATISNGWKKWQGMESGFYKADAVAVKKHREAAFNAWVNQHDSLRVYRNTLSDFNRIFPEYARYKLVSDYSSEAFLGIELMEQCGKFNGLIRRIEWDDTAKVRKAIYGYKMGMKGFYKNYSSGIDQKVFKTLMQLYAVNMDPVFYPDVLKEVHKKYKNNFGKWSAYIYSKSVFPDSMKFMKALEGMNLKKVKKLMNDPALEVYQSFSSMFNKKLIRQLAGLSVQYDSLYRIYTEALLKMNKEGMYPDANLSLRIAFGKVAGYHVTDAVDYISFTTLDGLIAKEDTSVADYHVPAHLKELHAAKDYGRYAAPDGTLHLCFLATNHTTGGNSGSPVINANGALIGLNFDRNWEGTMNDFLYDQEQCRNISLDVRYLLFIMDKYAGAGYLLREMEIEE